MIRPGAVTVPGDTDCMQRRLRVNGIVQGVGFRPFVWRLASELHLTGWVHNGAGGVDILVEGPAGQVQAFTDRLPREAPSLSDIRALDWEDSPGSGDLSGFTITDSTSGPVHTMIGHDTAVCHDCLAEMFDPADRRWRHAFINCTNCGPRYTLTRRLPYDRAQTSMAAFPMCADCANEYVNPADRRFHAEPTACPVCGPRLWLAGADGRPLDGHDPIAECLRRVRAGEIIAIKGLGGFHLACDARNAAAVARLRQRKHREEKPFAIMAASVASARKWVEIDAPADALLTSAERPIVLLRKRPGSDAILPGVAPGLAWLGVMLPYAPLHHLLFHEAAGRPAGTDWLDEVQDLLLVMTSANPGDEPLVTGNEEAVRRLGGIADALLLHDRDIVVRCDDSVVRLEGESATQFIRRARGYTPRAIRLPGAGPAVLALGGQLKNTLCITRGDEAFVSQHIGDLDNPSTCESFIEVAEHMLHILDVRPALIVHDLHPDFFSTTQAGVLASRFDVPTLAVQHHHAHIAAIAAEHGITQPLIGLAMDGVGLGADGRAWGGELLRVEAGGFTRLGHLVELPLPGGDRAAREPWRMAAAALHAMGRGEEIPRRFADQPLSGAILQLLQKAGHTPLTSSLGRCFDAAAGLLGIRPVMAYEGQAAMLLEGLAEGIGDLPALPGAFRIDTQGRLDLLPLLAHLADEGDARRGAALFHATLAAALADWAARAAMQEGITLIALGGGCFLNHVLTRQLRARLAEHGLQTLEARQAPPNDGGLSLGQAWIGLQSMKKE